MEGARVAEGVKLSLPLRHILSIIIQFPNTVPLSTGIVYGGGGLDQGIDPNSDSQSNQWSLTVERELTANTSLRGSYVGMHSYRLSITEDLDQIAASTVPYNQAATSGVYVDNRANYQNWTTLYSTFNHGVHRLPRGDRRDRYQS